MSLASRLYKPKAIKNLALDDPKAWDQSLWNMVGAKSLSGETVNEYTALTYSAVWCAVSLIAGTVSSLPLHLLRKDDKKSVFARDETLFDVLHSAFNPYMTAQIGRETMMAHLLTWGNAYAEVIRDPVGRIRQIWPIPPNRVSVKVDGGDIIYEVSVDDRKIILTRSKILHIPGLGYDGFVGYSPIAMARKSLGLGMAMESFGALYFGNGTHPGVVVSHPTKLSAEAHNNLKQSLLEAHSGLGQSHRLMLLEDGMKIEKIGIPPEDSQFIESREFQIPEVARWFNLPPHKLKDLSKANYNNIEAEQINFVTDSILPWLVRLEQVYDHQLLTRSQRVKEQYYTRHNVDGLLRGSAKDRAEYYRTMFGIGAMSINDVREKENWDPIDGGDERFVPLNMIPLSRIDEYLSLQNKSTAPDKKEDAP